MGCGGVCFREGGTPPLRRLWAFIRNRMLGAGRFFVVGEDIILPPWEWCGAFVFGRPMVAPTWFGVVHSYASMGMVGCSDAGCIVCFANSGAIPYGGKWSLDGSHRDSARYLFAGAHSDAPTGIDLSLSVAKNR